MVEGIRHRTVAPGFEDCPAEGRLMARVHARAHGVMAEACGRSSVPVEFLAALVANESGGDGAARRFEPAAYRHLKAVLEGGQPATAHLRAPDLAAELDEMRGRRPAAYHAGLLDADFAARYGAELAAQDDAALRELATSWGFTQIMGYHMVGRPGVPRDLLDPARHFRVAIELLAQFAEHFALDLTREFAELFRCWNTARPDGRTFDPDYVEKGLRRMEMYRDMEQAAAVQTHTDAAPAQMDARPSGTDSKFRIPDSKEEQARRDSRFQIQDSKEGKGP